MESSKQRQWEERYRAAVQPKLDEPVLAAGLFRRDVSPLASLTSRLGKGRSGRLPSLFVIAVTPMRLHAFGAMRRGDQLTISKELAAWDRSDVHVTAQQTTLNMRVTIEAPGTLGAVVCCTGKDAASRSVVRFMQDPAVVAA